MNWTQKKQKAPKSDLKIDNAPNFQIQVANGQLDKTLATNTLKFEIGDNVLAEHFVLLKKLTGPVIGLHSMGKNSVVINTRPHTYPTLGDANHNRL